MCGEITGFHLVEVQTHTSIGNEGIFHYGGLVEGIFHYGGLVEGIFHYGGLVEGIFHYGGLVEGIFHYGGLVEGIFHYGGLVEGIFHYGGLVEEGGIHALKGTCMGELQDYNVGDIRFHSAISFSVLS